MFEPGTYVVYGDSGLCRVEQVGVPDFSSERDKTYYFLRVMEDNSHVYVPTDTHMPLRAPLTTPEAEAFLGSLDRLPVSLPERRDRKTVLSHYQALLRPHTAEALAQVIKSIRSQHRATPGRMSGAEEALLKRAQRQLCGELAGALHLTEDAALQRLEAALTGPKGS